VAQLGPIWATLGHAGAPLGLAGQRRGGAHSVAQLGPIWATLGHAGAPLGLAGADELLSLSADGRV